jgi:hypothetical protein
MASGARWYAGFAIATAIEPLSGRNHRPILGGARDGFLRRKVGGEVAQVIVGEVSHHRAHGGILAPTRLEVDELFIQIARMLTGETWVDWDRAVAVQTMAGCTNAFGDRPSFCGICPDPMLPSSLPLRGRCRAENHKKGAR